MDKRLNETEYHRRRADELEYTAKELAASNARLRNELSRLQAQNQNQESRIKELERLLENFRKNNKEKTKPQTLF